MKKRMITPDSPNVSFIQYEPSNFQLNYLDYINVGLDLDFPDDRYNLYFNTPRQIMGNNRYFSPF